MPSPPSAEQRSLLEGAILSRFGVLYARDAGFVEDRACGPELALELAPVLDAFLGTASGTSLADVPALEHREALAMTSLFGRRVGSLAVTPSAAFTALRAFVQSMRDEGITLSIELETSISALYLEGYTASREEHLVREARRLHAESTPVLTLAPKCLVLVLAGSHEPESVATVVDRFGRMLLRANASSCVVDISFLSNPSPALAGEVFAADSSARMLGVACFFAGVSDAWREAATAARISFDLLRVSASFEGAAKHALDFAGYSLKPQPGLVRLLKSRYR